MHIFLENDPSTEYLSIPLGIHPGHGTVVSRYAFPLLWHKLSGLAAYTSNSRIINI